MFYSLNIVVNFEYFCFFFTLSPVQLNFSKKYIKTSTIYQKKFDFFSYLSYINNPFFPQFFLKQNFTAKDQNEISVTMNKHDCISPRCLRFWRQWTKEAVGKELGQCWKWIYICMYMLANYFANVLSRLPFSLPFLSFFPSLFFSIFSDCK